MKEGNDRPTSAGLIRPLNKRLLTTVIETGKKSVFIRLNEVKWFRSAFEKNILLPKLKRKSVDFRSHHLTIGFKLKTVLLCYRFLLYLFLNTFKNPYNSLIEVETDGSGFENFSFEKEWIPGSQQNVLSFRITQKFIAINVLFYCKTPCNGWTVEFSLL